MANERNDKDLAELLRAARAIPGPSARQKAVSAMTRATAAGSRRRSRVSWRRAVPAAAFVVVLVASGSWLLSKRHTVALADVARAMANVQSAHWVGWELEPSGARERIEGWADATGRMRMVESGLEEVDDGERLFEIRSQNGSMLVTIRPSRGQTYLRECLWPEAAQAALERRGETLAGWERRRLSDGRSVTIADLTDGGRTTRLMVDEATNLIVQMKAYRGDTLVGKVEQIEYNVDIPDEVFEVAIPEGAIVEEGAPPSSGQDWARQAEFLDRSPDWSCTLKGPYNMDGGSVFHRGLRFVGKGAPGEGVGVWYNRDRNVYYVLGKVRVFGMGLDMVVEDAEFTAPGEPQQLP